MGDISRRASVAFCCAAAAWALGGAAFAQAAPAPLSAVRPVESVESLIARHLAARGGRDVLAAVRSVRMQGTIELNAGLETISAPVTVELLPQEHKARLETTLGGRRAVTIFDGRRGWRQAGDAPPEELHGAALATIARTAEFGGLLFDAAAHGRTVEALGPASVHGAPAIALRVTDPALGAWKVILAADTGLEIAEQCLGADGVSVTARTQLFDFRRLDGLVVPYAVETSVLTTDTGSTAAIWTDAVWQKIELGVALAPADFEMPPSR